MHRRFYPIAIGLVAGALACADRQTPTAPPADVSGLPATSDGEAARAERIAQLLARALQNPEFRAYVKRQLDGSPYREHKLQLQRFIQAGDRQAARAMAQQNGATELSIDEAARSAAPLELYFPVVAHRALWQGDEKLLVATAQRDGDTPVAFDLEGRRHLLNPDHPPRTPVLAVVPVETNFDRLPIRTEAACPVAETAACSPTGGTTLHDLGPGLYLTNSHFTQTFEGWLKGDPEYEVHIMGQSGASDSLIRYQCSGEHAPAPYAFDQNTLDWTGTVMLFSQTQLDSYRVQHPGQAFRIVAMEDDDTACEMRVDQDRWSALMNAVGPVYRDITGARDSLTIPKLIKAAKDLQNLLAKAASWIKTNDDLIGTAIQDSVVGEYHPGFHWIVKGEGNVTNGWFNLVVR
ncbi:MAG TPA: hypothetical protein VLT17_14270 [Gemmatimonadales bacterium]|jgi:hypothetical protein|nr:hypothetical protein [Gemmatimonadales bacterium]